MLDIALFRAQFEKEYEAKISEYLNPFSKWHADVNGAGNKVYRMYDILSAIKGNKMEYPHGITETDRGKLEGLTVQVWAKSI